jgi:hypothetical protein
MKPVRTQLGHSVIVISNCERQAARIDVALWWCEILFLDDSEVSWILLPIQVCYIWFIGIANGYGMMKYCIVRQY